MILTLRSHFLSKGRATEPSNETNQVLFLATQPAPSLCDPGLDVLPPKFSLQNPVDAECVWRETIFPGIFIRLQPVAGASRDSGAAKLNTTMEGIQLDPNNLGQVQEFVEGYKSCTKEVIDFLRINCQQANEESVAVLIGKILHQTRDFERKLRTDSRPIRNLEVLDKVRRKILEKRRQQHKSQRRFVFHERHGEEKPEFVWRPF